MSPSTCSSSPNMCTTKLQIYEPRRKMHGNHENTIKLQEKCSPSHPARALTQPPGAFMEPSWPFMLLSKCSSSPKRCTTKLRIHEPNRKTLIFLSPGTPLEPRQGHLEPSCISPGIPSSLQKANVRKTSASPSAKSK